MTVQKKHLWPDAGNTLILHNNRIVILHGHNGQNSQLLLTDAILSSFASSETWNFTGLIVSLNKIIWQLSQSPRATDTCLCVCVCTVALRDSSFCMLAGHSGDVLSLHCFNNGFISNTWKSWQQRDVFTHLTRITCPRMRLDTMDACL